MNAYLEQAQAWWRERTEQERRYMTIAGPLLVVAIFYWGIWTPLSTAVENAERAVQAERNNLNQMKLDAGRVLALQGGQGGPSSSGSLSQLASRSAATAGLRIARMQPQGDKLQLWVEDAQFETLLGWLAELTQQQGILVETLDVTAAQENGLVQVRRLQISRP
ncbi:type II secretion system protein M [Ferrimonas marina]|uniref:Type II secretion system protein M n=1 Tax=Ferrimonas marina TaxID=299255 RepID=A0A1M5Z9N1_9GAMM|nr:type II secretion system protein M [Ferrimonas marina]SHI20593.1 general secretion pathway protein M [Ferrimonas marina]